MYVYLFEAKSIQAYIFQSGKLKDLIAASERLDRLVDDAPHSTLNQVLDAAQLTSNLLDPKRSVENEVIGFTRCKGGAFYAFCHQIEPLQQLRSLWTLTVQQLFPGMEFTDALTSGADLADAMTQAHALMAQARNTPGIKFPLASAICQNTNRTGLAAVPLSNTARKETPKGKELLDADTEHHRQAYRFLELRQDTLLDKFTRGENESDNPLADLNFPLDTEDFPAFQAGDSAREVVRDLALVHVDGNGLGLLLRGLQKALAGKSTEEYSRAFRQFSSALANATQQAAFRATQWLYENSEHAQTKGMLPMRPIVLGGDDITLLCQADLAVGYVEQFCHAFKEISKQELSNLHKQHLKNTDIKPYLTASGGVLYHKASHPFTTCHELVEGLCQEAKAATKEVDVNVGPAALAFYRIGAVLAEDIAQLRQQTQHFNTKHGVIISSLGGYLLEQDDKATNSLSRLRLLADKAREKTKSGNSLPVSVSKFRQMATHLATGDLDEAQRIYDRALELQNKQSADHARLWITDPWLAKGSNSSWLSDLLIYAHFNASGAAKEVSHG